MNRIISLTINEKSVVLELLMYREIVDVLTKLAQNTEIKIHDFLFELDNEYEAFFYEDSHKSFFHLKDLVNYISEIKLKSGAREFYISKLDVDIDDVNVTVDEAMVYFVFKSMEHCKSFLKWLIEIIFLKNNVNLEKLFYYLVEWENQLLEVDEEFNTVAVHKDMQAYRDETRVRGKA